MFFVSVINRPVEIGTCKMLGEMSSTVHLASHLKSLHRSRIQYFIYNLGTVLEVAAIHDIIVQQSIMHNASIHFGLIFLNIINHCNK